MRKEGKEQANEGAGIGRRDRTKVEESEGQKVGGSEYRRLCFPNSRLKTTRHSPPCSLCEG